MTNIIKNTFSDLFNFQREIDRLFNRDIFSSSTFARGLAPAVNLFETDDELILTAELPGLEQKDIRLEVKQNILTLSGEKKYDERDDGVSYHRRERDYGTFSRSIQLPLKVDAERTSADYKDGILTVKLAKAAEAKPRQIEIK